MLLGAHERGSGRRGGRERPRPGAAHAERAPGGRRRRAAPAVGHGGLGGVPGRRGDVRVRRRAERRRACAAGERVRGHPDRGNRRRLHARGRVHRMGHGQRGRRGQRQHLRPHKPGGVRHGAARLCARGRAPAGALRRGAPGGGRAHRQGAGQREGAVGLGAHRGVGAAAQRPRRERRRCCGGRAGLGLRVLRRQRRGRRSRAARRGREHRQAATRGGGARWRAPACAGRPTGAAGRDRRAGHCDGVGGPPDRRGAANPGGGWR
mmetsp:Transcript_463/g.1748  ORF Transcript_463/g.1748 Transcript_463/m.1748 type:complete len:264 (+) Transcript_463:97-888(+)